MIIIICWIMSALTGICAMNFYRATKIDTEHASVIMNTSFLTIFFITSLVLFVIGLLLSIYKIQSSSPGYSKSGSGSSSDVGLFSGFGFGGDSGDSGGSCDSGGGDSGSCGGE